MKADLTARRADLAARRVIVYERQRGEAHLVLACHCAVPLALTPDLAYRLWANFQRDAEGQALKVPWIAVADLLLSRLCEESADELYEMDEAIRQQLLGRLERDPRFGLRRISEVAEFLLQYVEQQVHSEDLDTRDLALAQEWNALAYTKPERAAQDLTLALAAVDTSDKSELLRIGSIIDTLGRPLGRFESLLAYADAMQDFARGDQSAAQARISPLVGENGQIRVAGVTVTVPDDLRSPSAEVAAVPLSPAGEDKAEGALLPSAFTRRVIAMTSRPEPGTPVYFTVQLEPGGFQPGCYLTTVRAEVTGSYPVVLMADDESRPLEEGPQRLGPVLATLGSNVPDADLIVEFILPDELLPAPVDEWVVNGGVLGASYPVVVRSLSRARDPILWARWLPRWNQLQDATHRPVALIRTPQDLESGLHDNSLPSCLFLDFTPDQAVTAEFPAGGGALKQALATGIPVMVWPRGNHAGDVEQLYSRTISAGPKRLPWSVFELRRDTLQVSGRSPGLTLLWDDPQRIPPADSTLLEVP